MTIKIRLFIAVWGILLVSYIALYGHPESPAAPIGPMEVQEAASVTGPVNTFASQLISQQSRGETVVETPAKDPATGIDALMQAERIGEFTLGSSASKVLKALGKPSKKSKKAFSEVDALYHQTWYYPKPGITFSMVADKASAPLEIAAIKIIRPSKLTTNRGIKIGDPYAKVLSAYGGERDQENSVPDERLVAGSIYGGLLFTFRNGCVVEIFLGAAAE